MIPTFPSAFPSAFPSGAPGSASSVCLAPDCTDAQNEFNTLDGDASTCITLTEMSSSPNGLLCKFARGEEQHCQPVSRH